MTMKQREGHDSRAVANRFVLLARERGEPITILHLVKFVYLAHGWHLGFHGEPLICHEVQAWKLGPVVPEVYYTFRPSQGVTVTALAMDGSEPYDAEFGVGAKSLIKGVFDSYSKLSAYALSALTHEPGTPWHQAKDNGFYATIPNEVIRQYYLGKVKAQSES